MNVRDLIQLGSELSVGVDSSLGQQDQALYLRYLNLAHYRLFPAVARDNPYVSVRQERFTASKEGNRFGSHPFMILNVLQYPNTNNARILKGQSYAQFLKESKDIQQFSNNLPYWYYVNLLWYIYPYQESEIEVTYIPTPTELTLDTAESEIPYPPIFHHILADGMSYYIFQSEGGLKTNPSIERAEMRFEKGKQELIAYLMTLSEVKLGSTYSIS